MSSTEVTIHNSSELNNLSDQVVKSVTDLIFVSECCNDLTSLNLNRFIKLETIEIGDDCFENVGSFKINRLNHLKSLKVGSRSFSILKSAKDWVINKVKTNCTRSFAILNCGELESIEIGRFSFVIFDDGFVFKNLPKLSTIKIGSVEIDRSDFNDRGWSLNFCFNSSFVLKGNTDVY